MKKILIFFLLFTSIFLCSCEKEKQEEIVETINTYSTKSFVVMETSTNRVLDSYNMNSRLLPASITKILTCITVLDYFSLNQIIVVTNEMLNVEGSKIYLEVGDVITVLDLLYGLMLNSGNDAALALAMGLCGSVSNFVYYMNEEAKRIGMKKSTFENPHGLDSTNKNYTTAYDMALLMSYCLKNETFRKINQTKEYCPIIFNERRLYFHNKHRLIQNNEQVTGGKTGYTKAAGRTLVTSFKDQMEIVVVTFDCPNDWLVHTSLAKKTFEDYQMTQIKSTFSILYSLSSYGNYKINSHDLLFPVKSSESKKDIKVKINLSSDLKTVVINYELEEEVIGKMVLTNRRKDD